MLTRKWITPHSIRDSLFKKVTLDSPEDFSLLSSRLPYRASRSAQREGFPWRRASSTASIFDYLGVGRRQIIPRSRTLGHKLTSIDKVLRRKRIRPSPPVQIESSVSMIPVIWDRPIEFR